MVNRFGISMISRVVPCAPMVRSVIVAVLSEEEKVLPPWRMAEHFSNGKNGVNPFVFVPVSEAGGLVAFVGELECTSAAPPESSVPEQDCT